MNFLLKNFYILILFLFPLSLFAQIQTQSESMDVNLIVEGCNNNSICESIIGEDINSCPLDCPVVVVPEEENEVDRDGRSGSRVNILNQDEYSNVVYPDVTNTRVRIEGLNVFLSWINPTLTSVDYVRVTRSNFYNTNPYYGTLVYEGIAEDVSDNLNDFDKDYYYNFFVRYEDGNFSEGIGFVISAREPSIVEDVDSEVDSVDFVKNPEKDIFFNNKFNVYDLVFVQDSKKLRWKSGILQAVSFNPINVSFPKKDFFGEVKDVYIYVDLFNSEDKFYRRDILKLDYFAADQSYKGTIFDISDSKSASFRLSVMKENREENFVTGSINFEQKVVQNEEKSNLIYWLVFILIILILILFFKLKRSNK